MLWCPQRTCVMTLEVQHHCTLTKRTVKWKEHWSISRKRTKRSGQWIREMKSVVRWVAKAAKWMIHVEAWYRWRISQIVELEEPVLAFRNNELFTAAQSVNCGVNYCNLGRVGIQWMYGWDQTVSSMWSRVWLTYYVILCRTETYVLVSIHFNKFIFADKHLNKFLYLHQRKAVSGTNFVLFPRNIWTPVELFFNKLSSVVRKLVKWIEYVVFQCRHIISHEQKLRTIDLMGFPPPPFTPAYPCFLGMFNTTVFFFFTRNFRAEKSRSYRTKIKNLYL